MTSVSQSTKDFLHKEVERQVLSALTRFDPDDLLTTMRKHVQQDIEKVTDDLLGIDRRWSEISLSKSGALMPYLTPHVTAAMDTHMKPLILAELDKQLKSASIRSLITRAVKRKVKDYIEELGGYKSHLSELIEKHIESEIASIAQSYMSSQESDDWLSPSQKAVSL